MSDMHSQIEIACNPQALSPQEWAAHRTLTIRLFREQLLGFTELPNGYAWDFPAALINAIATFIGGERRCCPFFTFTLIVPAASSTLTLQITGAQSAKAILADALAGA